MILSHSWSVCRSLVQRVAPVLAVVLGSSLALKAQNAIGTQWSWVNVSFDSATRTGLSGPVGGLGMTWNECIGTAELTKTGLLNSNGVATTVGLTCNASSVFSWSDREFPLLTGSAFNFDRNTAFNTVINGLTPGKKYTLYLASYVPNETGSRNVYTLSNVSTSGSTQLVDNGGPNGKSYRWLRGMNYTRFENIIPDATNSIRLSLVSGSVGERAHLSGFQLIENPLAVTSPYPAWLAGYNFSSIPGADLTLDGDPDLDGYNNMEEFLLGQNPTIANQRPKVSGVFTTETWGGIFGTTVADLFASPKFYSEPDTLTQRPLSGLTFPDYTCSRSRAYITPTVSGNYTFWLCARVGGELFLSTDLVRGKYAKKRIAMISSELGHGAGIARDADFKWDRYKDQQSTTFALQAGQSYYLEVDNHHGDQPGVHTDLAWARDGGIRELIPAAVTSSYAKTLDDKDDDCLPDAWETLKGLNPLDNGYGDMIRQGERGDYDGDGLSNRDEYLLGTDPTNSDTDNDGISDGREVNNLGTNALVSNIIADTLVSTVGLSSYVNSTVPWTVTSGGLVANSFRGEATWNFTVPSAGFWLFRLNTELMGWTIGNEEVPVVLKVDGKIVTRTKVRYGSAKLGLLQALTPWLTAGSHQVTVLVDNMLARRTVRLVSLQLYNPANAAANLAFENQVFSHPLTSRTSPAYLEGRARDLTAMTVNGAAVTEGFGEGHWFTNITLLDQAAPQVHNIHYETNADTTGTYTWQATNVMDAEVLTIRQGDTLRLGAWNANLALTANLSFSNGGTATLTGAATLLRPYSATGTYTVTATLSSGTTATLTVKVIGAPVFPGNVIDILDSGRRELVVNPAVAEVVFEVPSDRSRMLVLRNALEAKLTIMPVAPIPFGIAARLFAGGPILAVQRINVIGISDAAQNKVTSLSAGNIPGYKLLNSPLTVSNLPAGGYIKIVIDRQGVVFPDGTKLKTVYPSGLVNGWLNLEFYYPLNQSGGYCHFLEVYDRNGAMLGGRWGTL
jgi:Bacterial TSP3 repeat/PA14 domain